jgi:hypothetical protein
MGLEEILQKILHLTPEERETLRRELDCSLTKPEAQAVTAETGAAIEKEQQASHDERGLPVEDVIQDPKS